MSSPIRFYFDFISHNAYLAWTQIEDLAARHARALEPIPVLFAALLNHTGSRGPAEVPQKSFWMIKNVLRKAQVQGIPLAAPASHPFNPLSALRAVLAVTDPEQRMRLIDRLFRAVWAESVDLTHPAQVAKLAEDIDIEGSELIELIRSPDIKDALHHSTNSAIRAGVFGVPTILVDGELFWGYDDLPFVDAFLSGTDPLQGVGLQRWLKVRPSALR